MYKLLRTVSLVLFAGGFIIFPLMPGLWVFFLPFVGMVGYLITVVLEDPELSIELQEELAAMDHYDKWLAAQDIDEDDPRLNGD